MGKGYLTIQATTAEGALPVSGANVKIMNPGGQILFETTTDAGGDTESFALPAPDKQFTLDPNFGKPAYSIYTVQVSAPGFIAEHISGVEVLDTETSILPVNMRPLPASLSRSNITNFTDLPPHGLLMTTPNQQVGSPDQPAGRVLSEVIIPDFITVHLGAPTNASARSIRVRFTDYIKNVASHEIYSTWPNNSLAANIHAIVTYALNRVYTEWYRSRGYNFDITNNTGFDMLFREGGQVFKSISDAVDNIFNVYLRRTGFRNPFFTSFCDGVKVKCNGLWQWGTVTLAQQDRTPIHILQYYYPDDVELVTSNNISGITESYPGTALKLGSTGDDVRRMQNYLNRIHRNYPNIPAIPNPNGTFDQSTENAVKVFQRQFNITQDGIIGRNTWNRISFIYVSVTRLAELDSEGERIGIGATPPTTVISQSATGALVQELQFILNMVSEFFPSVPSVIMDGSFGAATRSAVIEFQKTFGLAQDGVVGPNTWRKLYDVYRGIEGNVPHPPTTPEPPPGTNRPQYPGAALRNGSSGENVRLMQNYLNTIRKIYPSIPALVEDGRFGPLTEAAVIAFQRQFALTPDGVVGPLTWNRLMQLEV